MSLYEVTIKHNKTRKTLKVLNNVQSINYDAMPIGNGLYVPCYRITLAGVIDIITNANDASMIDYEYHNPIVLWYAYFVDLEVVKIGL